MNTFFERIEPRMMMSATISPTQKANLEKLATDLAAIHAKSSVTVAQIHQFETDAATALKAATNKPSSASVATLKAELKTTLTSGPLTRKEAKTLITDWNAILTSAGIPESDIQAVGSDVKGIITASHVTIPEAEQVWSDLEAIYATYVANH
jgi:hypothetical protein